MGVRIFSLPTHSRAINPMPIRHVFIFISFLYAHLGFFLLSRKFDFNTLPCLSIHLCRVLCIQRRTESKRMDVVSSQNHMCVSMERFFLNRNLTSHSICFVHGAHNMMYSQIFVLTRSVGQNVFHVFLNTRSVCHLYFTSTATCVKLQLFFSSGVEWHRVLLRFWFCDIIRLAFANQLLQFTCTRSIDLTPLFVDEIANYFVVSLFTHRIFWRRFWLHRSIINRFAKCVIWLISLKTVEKKANQNRAMVVRNMRKYNNNTWIVLISVKDYCPL